MQEFENLFDRFEQLPVSRPASPNFQFFGERFRAMLLGIVVALCWLVLAPVAQAAPCHRVNDRTVCIVEIKRSAKYPWEYRVILSQDGVKQPQVLYHCRDAKHLPARGNRLRTGADGIAVPFLSDGFVSDSFVSDGSVSDGSVSDSSVSDGNGDWICRLVKR